MLDHVDSASHLVGDLAAQVFAANGARRESAEPDDALWKSFRASGLDKTLAVGEPGDVLDASVVLRAAGAGAAFVPAAEAILANWLAARAHWSEDSPLPTVVTTIEGWERVPWGRFASVVYFVADGCVARCVSPAPPASRDTNLAGEPRDCLRWPSVIERSPVRVDPQELACLAALLRASMMVGAMDASLKITLDHAAQRVQFGRPIAQFQAVQQMLAQFAAHVAAATAAVELAVSDFSPFTAAVAKARASEAAGITTEIAHQVCGAIGFTMEFPLQRYSRRLWAWRDEDGNEAAWNRAIGSLVASRAAEGLWPLVSNPQSMVKSWRIQTEA